MDAPIVKKLLLIIFDISLNLSSTTKNRWRVVTMVRIAPKKITETKNSQSLVGRANENKTHGLIGMIRNPYVFATCAFASLGCMMYGYDQGVMGPILVMEVGFVATLLQIITNVLRRISKRIFQPLRDQPFKAGLCQPWNLVLGPEHSLMGISVTKSQENIP